MNPDTNRLEVLKEVFEQQQSIQDRLKQQLQGLFDGDLRSHLLRPDGSEVPKHWAVFQIGELVALKDYTFKIAYMNDGTIILEPVGPADTNRLEALKAITDPKLRAQAEAFDNYFQTQPGQPTLLRPDGTNTK